MEHPNETLIRRFYEARAGEDRTTLRQMLAADVRWHDPYPPPHGGDLVGADAVFRDVFDAAGALTGGSTRLRLEEVLATDRNVAALIGWSSTFRGRTMEGREIAVFAIRDRLIAEAWFHPEDPAAALAFFSP